MFLHGSKDRLTSAMRQSVREAAAELGMGDASSSFLGNGMAGRGLVDILLQLVGEILAMVFDGFDLMDLDDNIFDRRSLVGESPAGCRGLETIADIFEDDHFARLSRYMAVPVCKGNVTLMQLIANEFRNGPSL